MTKEAKGKAQTNESAAATTGAREYADAQQRFSKATASAQVLLQKLLLNAYRDYSTSLQEAQRDLEGRAFEAYQNLVSAHVESSAVGGGGAEAYQEYVRAGTEVATQSNFQDEAGSAYQELMMAVAGAQNEPDAQPRLAAEYSKYVGRLESTWKTAQEKHTRAEQAYTALVKACNDDLTRRQQDLKFAYEQYAGHLKEAHAQSDFEKRVTTAADGYVAAVNDAWKQAQTIYNDAAAGLIAAQKAVVESLSSPLAEPAHAPPPQSRD